MKKILLVVILVTALAALFASQFPDGLEQVAVKLGFIDSAQEQTSIFTDYSCPFISNGMLSTFLAGILGILIIIGIFIVFRHSLRK
jgi:hypothetical protein